MASMIDHFSIEMNITHVTDQIKARPIKDAIFDLPERLLHIRVEAIGLERRFDNSNLSITGSNPKVRHKNSPR